MRHFQIVRKCIVTLVLPCAFSNVSSNDMPEKRHSRIVFICLTFLHCVFSNVSSNRLHVRISGDNLLKNRPRASTSEYKQLPINLRLFQNTVKLLDNLFLSEKAKIRNWRKKFTKIIVLFWIQSILLSFFLIFIHKHFDHSSRLSFKNICIVTLSPS